MATEIPAIHDVDEQELADLLRNLAYGIEEGDVPITAVETGTGVETDEALQAQLTLEYRPPNEMLIPGVRLTGGYE